MVLVLDNSKYIIKKSKIRMLSVSAANVFAMRSAFALLMLRLQG